MEWTRGPTIGRGSTASVSLATTASGDLFAVKSTDLSSSSLLQKEQHFLSKLNHPYIVKYMGFDITYENNKPMYNIFMEYVSHGTISDVIKSRGGSINEPMIRLYTHQILQGLDYLHLNGLVHCDIKGQNVLIGKNGAKIADLGCAKMMENGDIDMLEISGTPVFMAPEVARGEEQGFAADVWALGCTIIEMATGSNPWPEVDDPVSAIYRIGYSGDVPEVPRWLSEDGKDFLNKCLKREKKERWTTKQLLQHPFLHNLEFNYEEFIWNSPTSVLDQGVWDSLEVSEDSRNPTHLGSLPNSPAERIRRLIGGTSSPGQNLPIGSDEEDWVTVRNNDSEESMKLSEQNSDPNSEDSELTHVESFMFSGVTVEELESSIENEDLLLDSRLDEISTDYIIRIDSVLPCENYRDLSVSRILNFEKRVYKNCLSFSLKFFSNCVYSS